MYNIVPKDTKYKIILMSGFDFIGNSKVKYMGDVISCATTELFGTAAQLCFIQGTFDLALVFDNEEDFLFFQLKHGDTGKAAWNKVATALIKAFTINIKKPNAKNK